MDARLSKSKNLILLFIFFLYLGLAIPSLNNPVGQWEWLNYEAAENIIVKGEPIVEHYKNQPEPLLIHPPVLSYLVATSFALFGEGKIQARIPGLIILGLNGFLLYLLVRRISEKEEVALVTLTLYLTNPLVIQGGLSLDFTDGNLMPLSFIWFFLCFFITRDSSMLKRVFLLGFSFAFCLLSKLTTPLAIPLTLLIFGLTFYQLRRGIILTLGVTLLGILIFTLIWVFLCKFFHSKPIGGEYSQVDLFLFPLKYIIEGKGSSPITELTLKDIVKVLFYVVLKCGPLFCLFAFIGLFERVRHFLTSLKIIFEDILLIFSFIVFFTYIIIQGGTSIFPKYHLPILPILAIYGAIWLTSNEQPMSTNTLCAGLLLLFTTLPLYFFLVGDYNLLFTRELKIALISGHKAEILKKLSLYSGLYFLIPSVIVGFLCFFKNRSISPKKALLFVLIASQVSLASLQGIRPYLTKYYYGFSTLHLRRVIQTLEEIDEPKLILAPSFFVNKTGCRPIPGWMDKEWSDLEKVKQVVSQYNPQAVVYCLYTNTIPQLRAIRQDQELQFLLQRNYVRYDIGENVIWLKQP